MRNIITSILISCSFVAFGQPRIATSIIEENGERFYQHKIEDGNTLWQLQQIYDVPAEVILNKNPSLKEGLKVGQIVMIPIKKKYDNIEDYIVKEKETLYGLSMMFEISVDNLIKLNPELIEGLKKGQVIKVPRNVTSEFEVEQESEVEETGNPFMIDTTYQLDWENYRSRNSNSHTKSSAESFSDSTVRYIVMADETIYSISKRFMVTTSDLIKCNNLSSNSLYEGQVLIIPVKMERIDKVDFGTITEEYDPESDDPLIFEIKDEYNIAILLPFHLDSVNSHSKYLSYLSAHFYMGASMALDSLQTQGLNAKVHFFDTSNDSASIIKVLSEEKFTDMDLVIGPLISHNMDLVSAYCKQHKIRMVSPVSSDASLLKDNRLVYASVASSITLMNGLALCILENNADDNILLIKPNEANSMPLYEAFRKTFVETDFDGDRPNLIETTVDGFKTYIKRGVNTRFIVPTLDRHTAVKFMNNLNKSSFRSNADNLFVYGTREWLNYTEINNIYKNRYNFHYVSSNMEDYYSELAINMNRAYRSIFKTDMSKLSMQAYDVVLYYLSCFFLDGKKQHLLMNDFNMRQVSQGDGYENSKMFLIEQEEFELIKSRELN